MDATPLSIALAALPPVTAVERERLLTDRMLTHVDPGSRGVCAPARPTSVMGRHYPLTFLLSCLVAALLCTCDSTLAGEQWCVEHQTLLHQLVGPLRYLSISVSHPLRIVVSAVVAASVRGAFGNTPGVGAGGVGADDPGAGRPGTGSRGWENRPHARVAGMREGPNLLMV